MTLSPLLSCVNRHVSENHPICSAECHRIRFCSQCCSALPVWTQFACHIDMPHRRTCPPVIPIGPVVSVCELMLFGLTYHFQAADASSTDVWTRRFLDADAGTQDLCCDTALTAPHANYGCMRMPLYALQPQAVIAEKYDAAIQENDILTTRWSGRHL